MTTATFGPGHAVLSKTTGAPLQFTDPAQPQRRFLLDERSVWHSLEHEWGSGFVITDTTAARWNTPESLEGWPDGNRAVHALAEGLHLIIDRTWNADRLTERYTFRNTSEHSIQLDTIGIQTPFADLYEDSARAIESSVHAHVFTGGRWSWVLAQPMSGSGRSLGLIVTEGTLQAYSVESRNPNTLSNARGHLVMHPVDAGRSPNAFGGQQPIALDQGTEWTLAWSAGWYDSSADFITDSNAPANIDRVAVAIGEPITIRTAQAPHSSTLTFNRDDDETGSYTATSDHAGVHEVWIGADSRTEVLVHEPLLEVVRKRAEFILRHQRTGERPGSLAHALVPYDNSTGLTQLTDNWSDWSDGSERIGMAVLLQQARDRGLIGEEAEAALDGWALFAREHLLDDTAAPRRGSQDQHTGARLYDSPWLAIFFALRARSLRAGRAGEAGRSLDLAARILERAFELGAERFLAILFGEAVELVVNDLDATGQDTRAVALRQQLIDSARHFVTTDVDLPAHEVAYEQSIVAPLISMLSAAERFTGDPAFTRAIEQRLPWLLAFGGPQPHARLKHIAIRHWDGYWFGRLRLWGDVFPHYWSTLTAVALLQLPTLLRTDETAQIADSILHSNMINFDSDGSATCAFVMPSAVDGAPAHVADPLANDQDWHLVMWMLLRENEATAQG